MNNLATCNISSFRSAKDLVSKEPAQLLKTIDELEMRIQEQNSLLAQKDLYIQETWGKVSQNSSQLRDTRSASSHDSNLAVELVKVKSQLREITQDREALKAKYQALLRRSHSIKSEEQKEIAQLRAELRKLQESQKARIAAEREAERERVQGEMKAQIEGWQRMFSCLEKLSVKSVSILSEHEADSQEIRELARELRQKPNDLRASLSMCEITYQDAFEELTPLLHAATGKIATFKKKGLPITKVEHRARMLLERLSLLEGVTTSDAIKFISGDEGRLKVHREEAIRAMKKAASLDPHKAVFCQGDCGMPCELKRNGGY